MLRNFLTVLVCILLFATWGIWALFSHPHIQLELSCGYASQNWSIQCLGIDPFLLKNDIPYPNLSSLEQQSLNGLWKMRADPQDLGVDEQWHSSYEGHEWVDHHVPSSLGTYRRQDPQEVQQVTWFAKEFEVDPKHKQSLRWARLGFEGVLLTSEVWLNGTYLGRNQNGYSPFYFDITSLLKKDAQNLLVLRVDPRPKVNTLPAEIRTPNSPGWAVYGGIYRDVGIDFLPQNYLFKVARIFDGKTLQLKLFTHHRNYTSPQSLQLKVSLQDQLGSVVASYQKKFSSMGLYDIHTTSLDIDQVRLWNPENPYLYQLNIELQTPDQQLSHKVEALPIGLNTIETQGEHILLNGESIFLKGISMHADDPDLGAQQSSTSVARDLDWVEKLGANYLRLAHYPHDRQMIDQSLKRGLMISQEIPFYQIGAGFIAWVAEGDSIFNFPWSRFGTKHLYRQDLFDLAALSLIEMIERDRLQAHIIMWGLQNESYSLFPSSRAYYQSLANLVRWFDSSRLITSAEQVYDIKFLDSQRQSAEVVDVVSINAYYGWYYGSYDQVGSHLDQLRQRFPDKPIILSEFGADAAPGRRDEDGFWQGNRVLLKRTYSESYQSELIQGYWDAIQERPFVRGLSPWVFADFYCPWFPDNPIAYQNLKGILSMDRQAKESFGVLSQLYHGAPSP